MGNGDPTRDNATVAVTVGDCNSCDGNLINAAFHRNNRERDNRDLGHIDRGETKIEIEDLDASTLKTLEFFLTDTDDICITDITVLLGPEPSGTGQAEGLIINAGHLGYLTRYVPQAFRGRNECMWFGDENDSITNMKFNWAAALTCRDNFFLHSSTDYAKCLSYAMHSFDFKRDGKFWRYNFSGLLPYYQRHPYQHISSRSLGENVFDLQDGGTDNYNVINVDDFEYASTPQLLDFSLDGRIHSVANPTKCLEAGSRGTLYQKAYLYDCHDGAWQQWTYTTSGRIRNRHHGKYLGVAWCGQKINEGKRSIELRWYEDSQCGEAQKWLVRGA